MREAGQKANITTNFYARTAKSVPKKFRNIGIRIRIEDDALVTAKGCEQMMRGLPVDADEIEGLMWGG